MEFVIVWVAEMQPPRPIPLRLFLSLDKKETQDWVEASVPSDIKEHVVVNPRNAIRVSADEVVFVPVVALGETFEGSMQREQSAYRARVVAEEKA